MKYGGWITPAEGPILTTEVKAKFRCSPVPEIQTLFQETTNQSGPQKGRQPIKSGPTQGMKSTLNHVSAFYVPLDSNLPLSPLLMAF
jgi:hypothetical protein